MAVQYYNNNLYDVMTWADKLTKLSPNDYNQINGLGLAKLIGSNNNTTNQQNNSTTGMFQNPFSTAMSGTQSGTLQPYVNRMTQNANSALYGGLLGYSPRSIVSGDAGGTPVNSTPPQFNLPSAMPQGQGLNFTGFGNRSWMGK